MTNKEADVRGAPRSHKRLVVIGSSTGGPQALQTVLTGFTEHFPCPVVVVQHMPAGFTHALAQRLHGISQVEVREASDGEVLRPGCVYIAPGDRHLRIQQEAGVRRIVLSDEPPVGNHRPAVDVMYDSVALWETTLSLLSSLGWGVMAEKGCAGSSKMAATALRRTKQLVLSTECQNP